MAFSYKIVQRKNKLDGGKEIQVATQISKGKVPIRDIAKRLEQLTSLGRGDVMNVLTHLGEVVAEYMRLGYSVNLHELGTFTPRVSSKAVPAGEKFTSDHIRGVNMRFTPSTYLKSELSQVQFVCQNDVCKAPSESPQPPKETTPSEDVGADL